MAVTRFIRLQFLKLLARPAIRSAFDRDRLVSEWHLCRLPNSDETLYVGVHDRSFIYQLIFRFDFLDISDDYLIRFLENVSVGNVVDIQKSYKYCVLSGVLGYGTDSLQMKSLLGRSVLGKKFIIDWRKNVGLHQDLFETMNVETVFEGKALVGYIVS